MAAAIDLRSDVLSILRRSSAIFFSTSVVGPLLLSAASLLLFLFRSLILYLTFRCTASLMKHHEDDPFHSNAHLTLYYQLIIFLLSAFAFVGHFVLFAALHFTALLTVLSSLLNRPSPTAGSYMATIRNDRLFVFHETLVHVLMPVLVESAFALYSITYVLAGAGGVDVSSLWSVVMEKTRLGLSPFPTLDDKVGQYPVPLIAACSSLVRLVTVVAVNLAPWAVLFLGPADERRMGAWGAVKQGCFLMFVMSLQAMVIKPMEELACGVLRRKGSMAIIMAAGDWRALFVVLVVKSVAEAFFVVVWLVFYIAARCRAAELGGEAFGMQDLDECFARLR